MWTQQADWLCWTLVIPPVKRGYNQIHIGLFWVQFYRVNGLCMLYLCKGFSASCNSPRLLNKGSCFLTDPLSIMDAPLGILPSSQGSLAAGFKMDLKEFKIKSTWTLSTCNTNFEACVLQNRKTGMIFKRTALCRTLTSFSQPWLFHFLTLCLSGRVGISTYGKQFLCGACNKLEIPKQKTPQQDTGSTPANKRTIRRHPWCCSVLLIMESGLQGTASRPLQKACRACHGSSTEWRCLESKGTFSVWVMSSTPATTSPPLVHLYFNNLGQEDSGSPSQQALKGRIREVKSADNLPLCNWEWCMNC